MIQFDEQIVQVGGVEPPTSDPCFSFGLAKGRLFSEGKSRSWFQVAVGSLDSQTPPEVWYLDPKHLLYLKHFFLRMCLGMSRLDTTDLFCSATKLIAFCFVSPVWALTEGFGLSIAEGFAGAFLGLVFVHG